MSIHITEVVQKRLQFPPLQKIDPNTESNSQEIHEMIYPVTQAAIMTALAGLYKITRTTEGSVRLLLAGKNATWLNEVYGKNLQPTFQTIADYTHSPVEEAEKLVKAAADTSIMVLHEQLAGHISAESFTNFMSGQRDNILAYLPAGLHIGELLHDPTIDDNTNKMKGPISSFMHKIENVFSEGK
ncbi:MAG: hypothetical protein V4557_09785 [Bacteroidota bacterium]